jgi:retron-type reverse transcriptase
MELMSVVLERGNMMRAYERVLRNKGAPGVDDMTVGDLKAHLKTHWPEIREQLQVRVTKIFDGFSLNSEHII